MFWRPKESEVTEVLPAHEHPNIKVPLRVDLNPKLEQDLIKF